MAKKIMSRKEMLKEQNRIKKEKRMLSEGYKNEDVVKSFIIITVCVIAFLFIVYAGMNILKGNWKFGSDPIVVDDSFDNAVMCGTILNQSETEYYVLAYSHSATDSTLYKGLIDNAEDKKIYNMDLDSGFNKSCIGEEAVISSDLAKLKLVSPTLLYIKDGKIEKSYSTNEDIIKTLTN